MRTLTLSVTLLIFLATSGAPIAAPRHHQDGHPNATAVVPPGWRLEPHDGTWRGNRYISPDSSSWFAAYVLPITAESVAAHMDVLTVQKGEAVTYLRRETDWLAVSGFKGDRIFYRKAVIACGGTVWHHIEFEYPASRKRQMDPFILRASQSIDHAENDSCGDLRRAEEGSR